MSFNAEMLKLAREAREFTQSDLAKNADVTQALVSKIENGLIVNPSDEVVQKLSDAVRFPSGSSIKHSSFSGSLIFTFVNEPSSGAKLLRT